MKKSNQINQVFAGLCAFVIPFACMAFSPTLPAANMQVQWRFNSSANPAVPEVLVGGSPVAEAVIHLGTSAAGYVHSDPVILGSATGVWDLGVSGTITMTAPGGIVGSAAEERVLTVTTMQFYDGAVYLGAASISVPGASLVSREEVELPPEPGTFGTMLMEESRWTLPAGPGPSSVILTALPTSSMIDSITIDSSAAAVVEPAVLAIQILGADPRQVEVSWPADALGFALQSTTTPDTPASWMPVELTPVVIGDRATVLVPAADDVQFFRLQKP